RLVHDLLHLNLAGQQLSLALAMIKLALDEALQARQVHVDIARDVASGNLLGSDGGNGLLEWNRPDLSTPRPTLAHPFVPVAQHFLVLLELLGHSVKRGLNGDGCRGSAFRAAICPDGSRRLSNTAKPWRAEFSSRIPLRCTSSGRNT